MKIFLFILYLIIPLIIIACSSEQKATGNSKEKTTNYSGKDSLYTFYSVPRNNSDTSSEKPVNYSMSDTIKNSHARMAMTYYVVQIGAFTTRIRAQDFASESRLKINYKIDISFDSATGLYVVRLHPDYTSHEEAERVRNSIWRIKDFKDAWITTIKK